MKTTHLPPGQHNAGTLSPLLRRPSWGSMPTYLALFLGLAALLLLPGGGANARSTTGSPHRAKASYTAISPHQAAASHATCQATQITLQGSAAPAVACLDGQKHTMRTGGSGPLAWYYQSGCPDDSLVLYWNGPLNPNTNTYPSGPQLCVNGSGLLNLCCSLINGLNWNDQASAFWSGCYDDVLYQDVNRGGGVGYGWGYPDGEQYPTWGNFPWGQVGNDQLSSIWQYNSHGGDDCAS